jgi:hypothetical protein
MAEDNKRPPKGFSSEEVRKSFVEESKHKLKGKHIDRDKVRERKLLLEALRIGDRVLFAETCDALQATTGTAERKQLDALFRKKHGYL